MEAFRHSAKERVFLLARKEWLCRPSPTPKQRPRSQQQQQQHRPGPDPDSPRPSSASSAPITYQPLNQQPKPRNAPSESAGQQRLVSRGTSGRWPAPLGPAPSNDCFVASLFLLLCFALLLVSEVSVAAFCFLLCLVKYELRRAAGFNGSIDYWPVAVANFRLN